MQLPPSTKKRVLRTVRNEHLLMKDVIFCMSVCIHRDVLGTKSHLVYDKSYRLSQSIPSGAWVFGCHNEEKCIELIMKYLGIDIPDIVDQSHITTFKELGIEMTGVPWHYVLPHKKFQSLVSGVFERCREALESSSSVSYCDILMKEHAFLVGLSRACIDKKKLKSYISAESNPTLLKTLSGFKALDDGACRAVRYNQLSTVTGRLTVESGPQILTLSKKYRDIISSAYEKGKICQIDFVSLEPRVARKLSGNLDSPDIYVDICNNVFKGELSRGEAKLAVLCALYGVSKRRLSNMLKGNLSTSAVIKEINQYFGTYSLSRNLNRQVEKSGKIHNFFGRELSVENKAQHVLISHFLQSTAVDISLLGFRILDSELKKECKSYRGLFIVHDALVIDINEEDYEAMANITSRGVDIDELGNFPLSVEVISRRE